MNDTTSSLYRIFFADTRATENGIDYCVCIFNISDGQPVLRWQGLQLVVLYVHVLYDTCTRHKAEPAVILEYHLTPTRRSTSEYVRLNSRNKVACLYLGPYIALRGDKEVFKGMEETI